MRAAGNHRTVFVRPLRSEPCDSNGRNGRQHLCHNAQDWSHAGLAASDKTRNGHSLLYHHVSVCLTLVRPDSHPDQADLAGSRLFSPGQNRPQQTEIPPLQVPHHGRQRGKDDKGPRTPQRTHGSGVQNQKRSTYYFDRKILAQGQH